MSRATSETEPSKEQLRAEWAALAAGWIARVRGPGDPSRDGLLDEWMLDAVGDVRNRDVIDLGCGEGRFARMLAERGARVTGVDLCEAMVRAATEARRGDGDTYALGDIEDLRHVPSATFDLAVSYLSLLDVCDFARAVGEAHRVLRPGGRFVVCNLAPMATAGNMWVKYGDGTKLHYRLDNYLDETTPRVMPLCGVNLSNFHRTLSSYVNTFLATGFVLEGIREPYPSKAQLARRPENDDLLRVPLFIIYLLRKPAREA